MVQCHSCRCQKPTDQYKTGEREFKTCQSCRDYQRDHRQPYDKERQRMYSREHYLRRKANKSPNGMDIKILL